MKKDVEEYERVVKQRVQLEEQARLKEQEAKRLNENAYRLKNKVMQLSANLADILSAASAGRYQKNG